MDRLRLQSQLRIFDWETPDEHREDLFPRELVHRLRKKPTRQQSKWSKLQHRFRRFFKIRSMSS
ncbi:unnamed protein product [Caenorhabditis brenneri]